MSDGTASGTVLFKDINPGNDNSSPQDFTLVGNVLYFSAENDDFGREVWRTDGTTSNTERVSDIRTGPTGSDPRNLRALNNETLLFYAQHPTFNFEPFVFGSVINNQDDNRSSSRSSTATRSRARAQTQDQSLVSIATTTPSQTPMNQSRWFRDLTLGDTGDDVRALQQFLNQNGFILTSNGPGSMGNETILFGQLTQQALARFQVANGISPAVGYFGPVTRALVERMATAAPVQPVATSTTTLTLPVTVSVRDLEVGMTGDDVRALQTILINAGHAIPAGATGLFGAQTRDALAAYQRAAGIAPAAGYFGPATRAQMKTADVTGTWW